MSKRGNFKRVEAILEICNETDINTEDSSYYDYTPLIWACHEGHLEVVGLLLREGGVNINKVSSWERTPLIYASRYGYAEIVLLLLEEAGININHKDHISRTALISATHEGYSDVANILLEVDGIDVNAVDSLGHTALYWASYNGLTETVKLLLQKPETDINRDYEGVTALWCAYERGHSDAVQHLLEHPKTYVTTGNWTSEEKDVKISNLIFNKDIKNIAPINTTKHILVAALLGDITKVSYNLELSKSYINTNDSLQRSPLFWASTRGHVDVAVLLLTKDDVLVNKQRAINGATALYQASMYGHLHIIEKILENPNVDVNLATFNRETPLIAATINGHFEVVQKLLSVVNIDTNYATFNGKTALIYSVSLDQPHVLQLILRCPKTETSSVDENYKSALDIAKDSNNNVAIYLFTSRGNIQMRQGHTCCSNSIDRGLHTAVQNDDKLWIKTFLVCPGININVRNKNGQSPLHLAVEKGLRELVVMLLADRRIDVNKLNTGRKQTALQIASYIGNFDLLKLVLRHDQTFVNMRDASGNTAISIATKEYTDRTSNKYFSIVALLIRCAKTNVLEIPNYSGYYGSHIKQALVMRSMTMKLNPSCCFTVANNIMISAWVGDFKAIKGLLQCPGSSSNVNSIDKKGKTPLFIASMMGHLEAVEALLENSEINANLGAIITGGTPYSIASEKGHFSVMKVLTLSGKSDENAGWCSDIWVIHQPWVQHKMQCQKLELSSDPDNNTSMILGDTGEVGNKKLKRIKKLKIISISDISTCDESYFPCDANTSYCIPWPAVCDSEPNCNDGRDESDYFCNTIGQYNYISNTPKGVLISPSYPERYPHNAYRVCTISQSTGTFISFNVLMFNLYDKDCPDKDFLEIRDGGSETSPLIGKFCGQNIPPYLHTTQNQAWIK